MPGTTQTLESCAANPPGAGLVTQRRIVQVSQIQVEEPTVPQRLHTTKQNKDSICFPSYYQVPINVAAKWTVSPVDTRSPFNSWINCRM